jgi:methyltransferase (TIGR00027 family)
MSRKAAQTGPGAMVLVAMEQYFPEPKRIATDNLALPILPFGYRAEVRLLKPFTKAIVRKSQLKVPGLWGSIMSRKRYIDEMLDEDAGRVEAIVNLGAGFDTRAFRLPNLVDVPNWEVDQRQNIDSKRARVEKLFQPTPQNVTLVPIDFDHQDLGIALLEHGYSPDRKTFFIWEGVTQYVSEQGIRATFDYLAMAPAGSRLVFTYTPKDFIDGENFYGQEYLYNQMLVKDTIWIFGIDPTQVDGLLGEYGWRTVEHVGYDELVDRYVKPTGRDLGPMAIERIVSAEKD